MPTHESASASRAQISMELFQSNPLGFFESLENIISQLSRDNDDLQSLFRKELNSLQLDNAELKRELKIKAADIAILQQNLGALFPRFSELPPDFRRVIWLYACRAPQVHTFMDPGAGATRSKINSIMNACKEARSAAISLQLDSFSHHTDQNIMPFRSMSMIKHYVNLDLDTIWFPQSLSGLLSLGLYVQWNCGLCRGDGSCKDENHVFTPDIWGGEPALIRRIAVNYSAWAKEIDRHLVIMFYHLRRTGVLEVLLVVGDFEASSMEDTVFVTPPHPPETTRHANNKAEAMGFVTWGEMESDEFEYLAEFYEIQLQKKKDSGGNTPYPIIKDMWNGLEDYSVPVIRFVEARKVHSRWDVARAYQGESSGGTSSSSSTYDD